MRGATIRRLIVFSVCTLGVGCLYLVPSLARSPGQVSAPEPRGQPTRRTATPAPTPAPTVAAKSPTDRPTPPSGSAGVSTPTLRSTTGPIQRPGSAPASRRTTPSGGASDPSRPADTEPPGVVPGLSTAAVTADRLSLTWAPARDNVGVVSYTLWLNGFTVASTVVTRADVRWFNDDTGQHVVQVKAVDAAGNQSRSSASVVVTRPSPSPTEPPSPSTPPSSSTPTPTPDPTPSATAPTAVPSGQPNGLATSTEGPRENT